MITLYVGGVYFVTTRETLETSSSNFFSGLMRHTPADVKEVFIDRDPAHFRHILNHLRGSKVLPNDLREPGHHRRVVRR